MYIPCTPKIIGPAHSFAVGGIKLAIILNSYGGVAIEQQAGNFQYVDTESTE